MSLVLETARAIDELGVRALKLVHAQMAASAHSQYEATFRLMDQVPSCLARFREGAEPALVVREGSEVLAMVILAQNERRYTRAEFCCLTGTDMSEQSKLGTIVAIVDAMDARPKDPRIGLCVHRLCRFEHDRELLESLGFEVHEWHWVHLDLREAEVAESSIPALTINPWSDSYTEWALQTDTEAGLIVGDGEFDPAWSLVLCESGEPRAFLLGRLASANELLTDYLFVLEPYRRRGFAKLLKTALLRRAQSQGVSCALTVIATANTVSARLNSELGYRHLADSGISGIFNPSEGSREPASQQRN